jgi:hypothetical protein
VTYEDFSSVVSYIEVVTSVAQQLDEIGHSVDNEELTVIMLYGLPDSFDLLIVNITVNYRGKLRNRHVRTTLLWDEFWRTKAASEGGSGDGDSALTAGKLYKTTSFKPVCHHCKKPGHIRQKCAELRRRKKPQSKPNAKSKPNNDSLLLATAFSSMRIEKSDWILDSGCTGDASGSKDWMWGYLKSEGKDINIANSERLVSKGQSNVKVIIDDNVEKTVTDVMHIPGVSVSLLSVCKLAESVLS